MDTFVDLPTFSTMTSGTSPILGGFWTSFSPIIFWGVAVFFAAVCALLFFRAVANAVDWANKNWQKNDPMDVENTHDNQKKTLDFNKYQSDYLNLKARNMQSYASQSKYGGAK